MNDIPQRTLNYPDTWRIDSIERYEVLHGLGIVGQGDIDAIEARLVWFREWREYFKTTKGVDHTLDEEHKKASGE